MKKLFLLSLLYLCAAQTEAAESWELRSFAPGARVLGMGGAFVAVADDHDLFYFNPAGVARLPGTLFTIDFPLGFNDDTIEFYSEFWDRRDDFENADDLPADEQSDLFDDLLDEIAYERSLTRVGLPLSYIRGGMGIGIFPGAFADALVFPGASTIPTVDLSVTTDLLFIASAGHSWEGLVDFMPNRFSAGVTLKHLRRDLVLKRKSVTAFSSEEEFDFLHGSSTGIDLGFLYDLSSHLTAGLAVYDLLASDLEWDGGADDPLTPLQEGDQSEIGTTMRLGLSCTPRWGWMPTWVRNPRLAIDWGRIGEEDMTFWKQIFFGTEATLGLDWLRGSFGFHQGYLTLGAGLGPLRYAFYGQELGRHAGQQSDWSHIFELRGEF